MPDEITEQVHITDVEISRLSAVKADDGTFGLDIEWKINSGRFHDIDAKYTVNVAFGGEKKGAYAVTVDKENSSAGTVRKMALDVSDKRKTYTVSLVCEKDGESCESAALEMPVFGFDNLRGEYQGGTLIIRWDSANDSCPFVFCAVHREGGFKKLFDTDKTGTGFRVCVTDDDSAEFEADIYATDGDRVFGVAQTLRFFPRGITLTSVERNGSALDAEFELVCSQDESEALRAALCIVKNGVILQSSEFAKPSSVTKKSEGLYAFKAEAGDFFADFLPSFAENVNLSAVIEYRGAATKAFGESACLPAAAPALRVREYVRGGALFSVSYSPSAAVTGYLGSNGMMYCSEEFEVGEEDGQTFSVRPVFCVNANRCMGISSESKAVSREYYLIEQGEDKQAVIAYRQPSASKAGNGGVIVHKFTRELFCSHLKEAVSSKNAVIVLEPSADDDSYTLKVSETALLSAEDNNAELGGFYRLLFGIASDKSVNSITPEGFYLLADAISRMCRCRLVDVETISRGRILEMRCCGVLPGDVLNVETSVYTEQTDPRYENVSGYALAGSAEYKVSLNEGKSDAELVFDEFMSKMANAYCSRSVNDDKCRRLSGAFDLAVNVRFPYLFLVYPINYYAPDLPASDKLYDNVTLVGGDNYSLLLDSLEVIIKNREYPLSSAYFSGRACVSVAITLFVNGEEVKVPVGTSVYSLMAGHGRFGEAFKLYRLDARREYCPVFVDGGVSSAEITLLSGDRIEF